MSGVVRLVAVAGAKGSPGVSTVAIGLALELAASRVETLLVDADAEDGVLAMRLEVEEETDARPLARASAVNGLALDTVQRAAVAVTSRLAVLDASGAAGCAIDGGALAAACGDGPWSVVVADLGHRFEEPQQELARRSDWLLWTVATDRLALHRADQLLERTPLPARGAAVILNRGRTRTDLAAGRALARRHGLPVMAAFGERAGAQRWGWRRGVNRAFGLAGGFREMARTIHPELIDKPLAGVWP